MISKSFFSDKNLRFGYSADSVTNAQICSVLPFDFNGKDLFIQFYFLYNGGIFPEGACFDRTKYYQVPSNGYTSVEIERFHFIPKKEGEKASTAISSISKIWDLNKKYSKKLEIFANSHFPFAADASGNDYWIEFPSGVVKYICLDSDDNPDNAIEVAPSFYDFCAGLMPN